MITALWILFFLAFPALLLWATAKNSLLEKIGGVVLCYITGIAVGNSPLVPAGALPGFSGGITQLQDLLTTLVVPIALPLLFFSMDIRGWKNQAGVTIKAFLGALLATLLAAAILFFAGNSYLGEESWKVAGMLIGCYTGGTPNMASIGTALSVSPSMYVAVHASDVLVSGVLLLLLITVIPRLLLPVLGSYTEKKPKNPGQSTLSPLHNPQADNQFSPFFTGFTRKELLPLLGAFGLAILIFGIGGALSLVTVEWASSIVAILTITTLGVICSYIPKVRNIRWTFQLGHYFLLIFSLVVSSMADIRRLAETAPAIMLYVSLLLLLTLLFHTLISKVLRVDRDTHMVVATALIFSPPFVPVVAAALKNKQVIMGGMIAGIAGWVIGNYAGIVFGLFLQNFL